MGKGLGMMGRSMGGGGHGIGTRPWSGGPPRGEGARLMNMDMGVHAYCKYAWRCMGMGPMKSIWTRGRMIAYAYGIGLAWEINSCMGFGCNRLGGPRSKLHYI